MAFMSVGMNMPRQMTMIQAQIFSATFIFWVKISSSLPLTRLWLERLTKCAYTYINADLYFLKECTFDPLNFMIVNAMNP